MKRINRLLIRDLIIHNKFIVFYFILMNKQKPFTIKHIITNSDANK